MTPGTPTTDDARGPAAGEDDQRRLVAARRGDGASVADLYDRHAGALYALARCVLRDPVAAEEVVVDAVVDSCGPAAAGRPAQRSVRHELSRATYRRCLAAGPLPSAARHRAVLALCLHGDHTYREAVAVTGAAGACLGDLLNDAVTSRGLALPA